MSGATLWSSSRETALHLVAYDTPQASLAVVVVHGLGAGVSVLRGAVEGLDPYARLAGEGFHVLGVDLPGHGRSGGPRGHLTYRAAMEALAVAVTEARRRWQTPVCLLGTGFGGVLAYYAALEGDGVAAVVSHGALDLRDVRPVAMRRRQATLLAGAAATAAKLSYAAQRRVRVPTGAVVATADLAAPTTARRMRRHAEWVGSYDLASLASLFLTPDDKPDVAAQRVPALVAVGTRDRLLPERAARSLVGRVPGARLWTLPDGGHQLLLEHPEAFVPVASAFLREHA